MQAVEQDRLLTRLDPVAVRQLNLHPEPGDDAADAEDRDTTHAAHVVITPLGFIDSRMKLSVSHDIHNRLDFVLLPVLRLDALNEDLRVERGNGRLFAHSSLGEDQLFSVHDQYRSGVSYAYNVDMARPSVATVFVAPVALVNGLLYRVVVDDHLWNCAPVSLTDDLGLPVEFVSSVRALVNKTHLESPFVWAVHPATVVEEVDGHWLASPNGSIDHVFSHFGHILGGEVTPVSPVVEALMSFEPRVARLLKDPVLKTQYGRARELHCPSLPAARHEHGVYGGNSPALLEIDPARSTFWRDTVLMHRFADTGSVVSAMPFTSTGELAFLGEFNSAHDFVLLLDDEEAQQSCAALAGKVRVQLNDLLTQMVDLASFVLFADSYHQGDGNVRATVNALLGDYSPYPPEDTKALLATLSCNHARRALDAAASDVLASAHVISQALSHSESGELTGMFGETREGIELALSVLAGTLSELLAHRSLVAFHVLRKLREVEATGIDRAVLGLSYPHAVARMTQEAMMLDISTSLLASKLATLYG